jgi:DNA-binding CsgD family transcriptional regulator
MMGKTSKKIAKCLGISYKTVDFHIANIKLKLNCYRKSDIVESYLDLSLNM